MAYLKTSFLLLALCRFSFQQSSASTTAFDLVYHGPPGAPEFDTVTLPDGSVQIRSMFYQILGDSEETQLAFVVNTEEIATPTGDPRHISIYTTRVSGNPGSMTTVVTFVPEVESQPDAPEPSRPTDEVTPTRSESQSLTENVASSTSHATTGDQNASNIVTSDEIPAETPASTAPELSDEQPTESTAFPLMSDSLSTTEADPSETGAPLATITTTVTPPPVQTISTGVATHTFTQVNDRNLPIFFDDNCDFCPSDCPGCGFILDIGPGIYPPGSILPPPGWDPLPEIRIPDVGPPQIIDPLDDNTDSNDTDSNDTDSNDTDSNDTNTDDTDSNDTNTDDTNTDDTNTDDTNTDDTNTDDTNTDDTNTDDTNTDDTNTDDTNTDDTNTDDTNEEEDEEEECTSTDTVTDTVYYISYGTNTEGSTTATATTSTGSSQRVGCSITGTTTEQATTSGSEPPTAQLTEFGIVSATPIPEEVSEGLANYLNARLEFELSWLQPQSETSEEAPSETAEEELPDTTVETPPEPTEEPPPEPTEPECPEANPDILSDCSEICPDGYNRDSCQDGGGWPFPFSATGCQCNDPCGHIECSPY